MKTADDGFGWAYVAFATISFFPNPGLAIGNSVGVQAAEVLAIPLGMLAILQSDASGLVAYGYVMAPVLMSAICVLVFGRAADPDIALKSTVAWSLAIGPLIPALHLSRRLSLGRLLTAVAVAFTVHAAVCVWQMYEFKNGVFPLLELYQNPSYLQPTEQYALWVRRPMGLFPEPSAMAASLGPWIVLALGALAASRQIRIASGLHKRLFVGAATIAAVLAVISSESGYTFVLVVCGGTAVAFAPTADVQSKRLNRRIALVCCAICFMCAATYYASTSVGARLNENTDGPWQGRIASLLGSSEVLTSSWTSLTLGVGPGQSSAAVEGTQAVANANVKGDYVAVWSIAVKYAVENGIAGLIGMVLVGLAVGRRIRVSGAVIVGWCAFVSWVIGLTLATSYVDLAAVWTFLGVLWRWDTVWPRQTATSAAHQRIALRKTLAISGAS